MSDFPLISITALDEAGRDLIPAKESTITDFAPYQSL
jgi:hypothetical protein